MSEAPTFSIVIPLHRATPLALDCIQRCLDLPPTPSYEVIVVTDAWAPELPPGVVHVSTGSRVDTSPAVKRDAAMHSARGEYLAFIDDDAFPAHDWLERALAVFTATGASGVGGPGVTPPGSAWRERLGGATYESPVGSGPLRMRFLPVGRTRQCDDIPAFNLIVARRALEAVGGWSSSFYGGEDTKVCLSLVSQGFELVYDPDVVVYHYRRKVLLPHLRQVANVGRHRGFFVRQFPKTSLRLRYFLPSAVVAMLPVLLAGTVALALTAPVAAGAAITAIWAAVSGEAFRRVGPAAVLLPPVILLHHVSYGISFVKGFAAREIDDSTAARVRGGEPIAVDGDRVAVLARHERERELSEAD